MNGEIVAIDVEKIVEWDEERSNHLEYDFDEPNVLENGKGVDEQ